MPEQSLDLQEMINSLRTFGGGRKLTQVELLRRAEEEKQRQEEKVRKFLADTIKTVGENPESQVETSSSYVDNLRNSYLSQQQDTQKFRARADMKPKDLMEEYKATIFDQKPGVLHGINRFLQGVGYGYRGGDMQLLPKVLEDAQKNQQRLIEGGKAEDNSAKALETASRMRQQAVDKFNGEKQKRILDAYGKALSANNPAEIKLIEMAAKAENMDMSLMEKAKADAAKAMQAASANPATSTLVNSQDTVNQQNQATQASEFAKGIGKNASKWLFERNPGSPGGIGQNGLRYDKDKNASGETVLTGVPTFGRLPSNPATPATGANVRDRFNQLGGMLGNAQLPGIAPQQGGGSPQLPGQTPQPEGIQPGMQPQGQQPRMQSPQATTSPQNRVVDTFLAKKNGNPLLVTDDDIKKAPQLYSTPIQGEQYIIVKNQTPVNPASQAAAGRFGAPAQITFGQPGEKTAAGKTSAEMKSNFISKASDVITALTDAAKEPSKIPGKSVAEATLGGPGTDPKGFISGMFNSDVPNRLPVVSDVAKKIAQLIHTNAFANKNADQTTSSIAAEFNVLLDLYKNDPKAKEFVTRYTQNISQLLSFYTKSITGSQVNQTELQQFAQVIPNLFMDPQTAMRQLVDFSTKISIGQELKSANYSEDQISRVMKNPTFTQFLQEESNKYASEMVRQGKMTSARPGVVNPPVDKNTLLPVNLLGKFMDKYGPEALGGISVKRISSMPGQLNPVEKPIVPSTTNKTLEYLRKRNKAYTGVPE